MKYLKISQFAKITGISRQNLIFYDKEDILHPAYIDPNNHYRYYLPSQIDTASALVVLRESNFSLDEIRKWMKRRNPEEIQVIFSNQQEKLEQKINSLRQLQDVLSYRNQNIQEASRLPHLPYAKISLCPEAKIIKSEPIEDQDYWLAFQKFIVFCQKNNVTSSIPISTLISQKDTLKHNYQKVSYFFYRPTIPAIYPTNDIIPAGKYLQFYHLAKYNETSAAYREFYDYLQKQNFKIIGDVYQEYLIDEASSSIPDQYVLRLSVQIR